MRNSDKIAGGIFVLILVLFLVMGNAIRSLEKQVEGLNSQIKTLEMVSGVKTVTYQEFNAQRDSGRSAYIFDNVAMKRLFILKETK